MTRFRIGGWALVTLSALMLLLCIRDELRGSTKPRFRRGGGLLQEPIVKSVDPGTFRNAMSVNWVISLGPGVLGLFLFSLIKSQESLDPLSPDFKSPAASEDWNNKAEK